MYQKERNHDRPAAIESQITWPDSVGPGLIDKYLEHRQGIRPIYWAIGRILDTEREQLNQLMFLKEKRTSEVSGKTRAELREGQYKELWQAVEGYGELEMLTQLAMMLEETSGEVEKHPDYSLDLPILGVSIVDDSSVTRLAGESLRHQSILQIVRDDPLGRNLLFFREKELEVGLKRAGKDPNTGGRMIGFRRAEKRYHQVLDYLIENKVVIG